ncbi:hypothetical protein PUN28_002723 [Cardiocondyla obscurior]|uniref:Uncharacterized protein n=1 Tax=Cardiocondyla obscurior TaxID=286306 RepID=A0AAW2GVQ6_9HYME
MEPPCRICTRRTPPTAFNPRTSESRYKSSVRRRREYCEPSRCNTKVDSDLKYEFNSRFYNVNRVANKTLDVKRNVQDFERLKNHDRTIKGQSNNSVELSRDKINDLKGAHHAVKVCLREIEKIKTFLEDENSWWKILKSRSVDCCQQKLPHLHGVLDGSSVTLILFEEDTDEGPSRFVTSMPRNRNDNNNNAARFETSSREELRSEAKKPEQYANQMEYMDSYTVPHYSLDMSSALIEVTSTERIRRYNERVVTSGQSIVASDFSEEDRSDERKIPKRSLKFKDTYDNNQYEDRDQIDRSNIMPSREMRHDRTMFEDELKSQEAISNENTASRKHIANDCESNVDLTTEIPSRNVSSFKPRTKTFIEKGVRCIQKLPTKIAKSKSKNV